MPTIRLDSLDDPRLARYRNLKATNATRDPSQFVVEGEKLLERLVESPFRVASALAGERHAARIEGKMPAGVPLYVVPDAMVDLLVGFNFHQGVLACGVSRDWPSLDAIADAAGSR